MAENNEKLLDDVGWQLLYFLQENARLSFKELGQRVGLAPSSVAERIHRMEEAEILWSEPLPPDQRSSQHCTS